MKNKSNKILGVGLPKTGTMSLNKALKTLGFRSYHSPIQYVSAQCLDIPIERWESVVSVDFKDEKVLKCVPKAARLRKDLKFTDWDALTNFGEHIYPILDSRFPNSKFILTVRDKEAWLKSASRLMDKRENVFKEEGRVADPIALILKMHLFHCIDYDEDYFSILYDNHLRNVKHYFKDREQDLLTMDICGGDGWEKLCPFLNKDIPDVTFPHKNETLDI